MVKALTEHKAGKPSGPELALLGQDLLSYGFSWFWLWHSPCFPWPWLIDSTQGTNPSPVLYESQSPGSRSPHTSRLYKLIVQGHGQSTDGHRGISESWHPILFECPLPENIRQARPCSIVYARDIPYRCSYPSIGLANELFSTPAFTSFARASSVPLRVSAGRVIPASV